MRLNSKEVDNKGEKMGDQQASRSNSYKYSTDSGDSNGLKENGERY